MFSIILGMFRGAAVRGAGAGRIERRTSNRFTFSFILGLLPIDEKCRCKRGIPSNSSLEHVKSKAFLTIYVDPTVHLLYQCAF